MAAFSKRRTSVRAFSMLALGLAAITGCAEGPGVVTFEGTVADELILEGYGYVEAHRDSVFCKRNLMQQPTLKDVRVRGQFRRLSGGRYRLNIDLRKAPRAGFCQWRLVGIRVEAASKQLRNIPEPVAMLTSARAPSPFRPIRDPLELPPGQMTSSCRHGTGAEARYISCVFLEYQLPQFHGDKTYVLNVRHQQGHGDPSIDP